MIFLWTPSLQMLPFMLYGRELCSSLPYEGRRPKNPPTAGCYHLKFHAYQNYPLLDAPFPAPHEFWLPSPLVMHCFSLYWKVPPLPLWAAYFPFPSYDMPDLFPPSYDNFPPLLGVSYWFRVWQPSIPSQPQTLWYSLLPMSKLMMQTLKSEVSHRVQIPPKFWWLTMLQPLSANHNCSK